jgi:predicted transcriptional regulator of viral defense system
MRMTERFFAENPVFSLHTFMEQVAAGVSARTAYGHVDYYVRTGRLRRLRSKLYATVPADTEADEFAPDPYLVASVAGKGAPLGYHTALELLGVGHSVFRTLTVVVDRWAPPFEFDTTRVEFVQAPAAFRSREKSDLGLTTVRRLGVDLTITGRERTLVDCLLQPGRAGGLEEVLNSLAGFGVVDAAAMARYLTVLNISKAWAIAGYYLEATRGRLFTEESTLSLFETHAPKARQYWVRGERGGVLQKRWNLIVPERVEAILGDS